MMISRMFRYYDYANIGYSLGQLTEEKNVAYGNSFEKCSEFLKLLYPDGVPTDKYQDMLTIVRIFDKLMRIAHQKDAFGESPYNDIVGYCLLAIKKGNLETNLEN